MCPLCSQLSRPIAPAAPQLVTPIFSFLAVEVDKKGAEQVEIGARTAYDDVNESLCMPDQVHKVRRASWGAGASGSTCWSRRPCRRAVTATHRAAAPAPVPAARRPQTLARLGVQRDRRTRAVRVPKDLYSNLLSVRARPAPAAPLFCLHLGLRGVRHGSWACCFL